MLSKLHSFFLKISNPFSVAAFAVLSLYMLWLIQVHGLPGIPGFNADLRIGLPDMMLTYSPSSIFEKLVLFGPNGRTAYRAFLERVDSLFPLIYGLFLVMATTFGLASLFPNRPALQKLSLLTLGTSLFDYAENICFLAMLHSFPRELHNLEKIANVFTLVKWAFAAGSMLFVVILALGMLLPNRKLQASA